MKIDQMSRKTIVLFCLLQVLFGYAQTESQVRNVILIIGDGMGLSQITYGMYQNKNRTILEDFHTVGLVKTHSASSWITDSAAGATAYSTGKKTKNGAIGKDSQGNDLETILEWSEKQGRSTALVSSCKVTHATPASFIAHNESRRNYFEIAKDFLDTDVDVVIGGGVKEFMDRPDGVNLLEQLSDKGYDVYTNEALPKVLEKKSYVLTHDDHQPSVSDGRDSAYLKNGFDLAYEIVSKNKKGFFMLVEASQIDWFGHSNELGKLREEQLDFERTVTHIISRVKEDSNTVVVVTADHETGGLGLSDIEKETGISGRFVTEEHTATMVPVFAYGKGSIVFTGIYENTAVYHKMKRILEGKL